MTKPTKISLAALAVALALTACENDSYDKGQGKYSLTQADLVEAYSNEDKAIDRVETDEGQSYTLVPQATASWVTTADSTYRAILYYNKVDDTSAEPVAMARVYSLSLLALEDLKEVKTDPVKFESLWMSKNGKYINMALYIKTGQDGDDETVQTIGMVCDGVKENADGTKTSFLRLYHDQGNVPEYYSSKQYISISCSAIEADSVCLTIETYDGTVTRRMKL